VHDEIQDWLIDNVDCFTCILSYDGNANMQNINRSSSAGMIDLDFFLKYYGCEDIKMTVSPNTLPMLAEGVISLHKKGFGVSCNLAYGVDWTDKALSSVLETELQKLIDYYITNPNVSPCSMLNMGIETVAYGNDKLFRFCGCGIEMAAYDVDGKVYPCHLFMPLAAGSKAANASELFFYSEEIPLKHIEEKCRDCVIKTICPTCYGSSYIAYGDIYKRDEAYCTLIKIIVKARSFLKGRQWELGQLKLSHDDEQMLLRSILIIQDNL
jgi:radical SAM protein with 4Fe4S-binding SPASM domain